MSNHDNYYYNIMAFRLKNQVPPTKRGSQALDLEGIVGSIIRYNMCLNPPKFSFSVSMSTFLEFMFNQENDIGKIQISVKSSST